MLSAKWNGSSLTSTSVELWAKVNSDPCTWLAKGNRNSLSRWRCSSKNSSKQRRYDASTSRISFTNGLLFLWHWLFSIFGRLYYSSITKVDAKRRSKSINGTDSPKGGSSSQTWDWDPISFTAQEHTPFVRLLPRREACLSHLGIRSRWRTVQGKSKHELDRGTL